MRQWSRMAMVTAGTMAVTAGSLMSVTGAAASAAGPPRAVVSIAPMAHQRLASLTGPLTTAQCETQYQIACYNAPQFRTAYDLNPLYARGDTGGGRTIVIVDSFGSPTIAHDLGVYDATYKLAPPPSLKIIQPAGAVPPYQPTSNREGWAGETTLDVEMAHTVAPGANILLVETPTSENEGTSGFPQIVQAENYVVNHHLGDVISQSFGATEETFPSPAALKALRSAYVNADQHGVTVLAATGDDGVTDSTANQKAYYTRPVVSWPPSDPLVTAVGGTQLHLNATGQHTSADTVWNDSYSRPTNEFIYGDAGPNPLGGNGGVSSVFGRPAYQNSVAPLVGADRGVPDVSMSGACNGAINTYESYGGETPGWYEVCGTSEATPLFAGIVALAGQVVHHSLGLINPALYRLEATHAPGLVDVTSGNNTVTFKQNGTTTTVNGYAAGAGYDLASGTGTVDAATFVPELALEATGNQVTVVPPAP